MEKFIYEKRGSIPPLLCKDIIELFKSEDIYSYKGVTRSGYNANIKDTIDFKIPEMKKKCNMENEEKWGRIKNFLVKELQENINEYLLTIKKRFHLDETFCFFNIDYLTEQNFQIQEYYKGVGKFTVHNDFSIDEQDDKHRTIVYLWYLNDVEEGGETGVFLDENKQMKIKIKPECGKLLLFPTHWTFPHCGCVPLSNNKYIITGWLYIKNM